MEIKVKYFGLMAEETGTREEIIQLEESAVELQDVRSFCFNKYGLEEDSSIQVAVNQVLQHKGDIQNGDEIAFLPPYAGG